MAFDGFVISNLVYELNNTILNAKISKIAQPETDELLFTLKGSNGQYRLAMFAEFEMKSNQMVEEGESLNAENLCKLYYELNQKYFGEDMVSDPQIAYEWARIPHFYYNFYVYQYATSFSAAVAIAHGILEEGAPAVERYKKFLSGGCSMSPVDLLKQVGINMEEPKPIQDALDVFGKVLDEIETLI